MIKYVMALAASLMTVSAHAATFTVEYYESAGGTQKAEIVMVGETIEGDYERFIRAIDKAGNQWNNWIKLEGPGGLRNEGAKIADYVLENKVSTYVQDAECASACAMIWISGKERGVYGDAYVGFHFSYVDVEVLEETKNEWGWYGINHNVKYGAMRDTMFYLKRYISDPEEFFENMSYYTHLWWPTKDELKNIIGKVDI